MADLDPKPAPTSTSASEEEEDKMFEIREWIDADGRELSSEVVSVKAAAEQVAQLDLVGKLQRAHEEAQQQQTQGNGKATSAGEAVEEEEPLAAQQQQRLLDAHDWAGIKARADELEREEARVRSGEAAKEVEARRGRDKLEGGGWGKGFLNNNGGSGGGKGGGGSSSSSNEAAKAKQAATRTTTRSVLSSPEKRKLAGERPRKHVSFQLDAEAAARDAVGGVRELGPFDDYQRLLQQHKQLRTRGWGVGEVGDEEQEECKDEAKRQPRPPPPVALSGRVGERGAEAAEATGAGVGTEASMPAAPLAGGPEAGLPAATAAAAASVIPPGMSRFKAQALGLLPSESN